MLSTCRTLCSVPITKREEEARKRGRKRRRKVQHPEVLHPEGRENATETAISRQTC